MKKIKNITLALSLCIMALFSSLNASDKGSRKRKCEFPQSSTDRLLREENLRKNLSVEQLCLIAMQRNQLAPEKFAWVLQNNDASRLYKDNQGRTWWNYVNFFKREDLKAVLRHYQIPTEY